MKLIKNGLFVLALTSTDTAGVLGMIIESSCHCVDLSHWRGLDLNQTDLMSINARLFTNAELDKIRILSNFDLPTAVINSSVLQSALGFEISNWPSVRV